MEAKKHAKKAKKRASMRSSLQTADAQTAGANEKRTRDSALARDAALAAQFEDEYVEDTDAHLIPDSPKTAPNHECGNGDDATDPDSSEPESELRLPRNLESLATIDQKLLRIIAVEDRADCFEMNLKTEFATLNAKLSNLNQNQLQARADYDARTKLDEYTVSTGGFDEMRPKLDRGPRQSAGLRAMIAKDVLSNVATFYDKSTKISEVLDPEECLPFQLWSDGCV